MAIVAPDGAERGRCSGRRFNDDVVDDGHVAAGGCDRAGGAPENVSSVFLVKWRTPQPFSPPFTHVRAGVSTGHGAQRDKRAAGILSGGCGAIRRASRHQITRTAAENIWNGTASASISSAPGLVRAGENRSFRPGALQSFRYTARYEGAHRDRNSSFAES